MKTMSTVLAAALALGAATSAHAGTTSVNFESSVDKSIRNLGSFSGTATYDNASGLLTITVNNPSASGARLTGVAFNIVGDGSKAAYHDGDVAGTRRDEDIFDDARAKHGRGAVKAKPVGIFEAGTGINGKINPPGKGLANRAGIAAGGSRTFTFDVTGGTGLTAADFIGGAKGLIGAFRAKKIDFVGTSIVPGSVTNPGAGGNNTDIPPIIIPPEIIPPIIPPINTGGGDNGNGGGNSGGGGNIDDGGQPKAVPLPPAAIPALATF